MMNDSSKPSAQDAIFGPDINLQDDLVELMEALVTVIFCAKDVDLRYLAVNNAFVRRTGRRSKREVIGSRAVDLFPTELAERYEEQDRRVFATGRPLRDQLEPVLRSDGSLGWYVTTKLPVRDGDGQVVGLTSVSRDLGIPNEETIAVESLGRVVDHVERHLDHKIGAAELAGVAECSAVQLNRRMKRVFGLSCTQYVLRARVDRAAAMLAADVSPVDVGTQCGFYDQADLTRQFARLTGLTPAMFRRQSR
ncbi:MAG: PAS domain-containing protein [Acidimicrobiales bacterium]